MAAALSCSIGFGSAGLDSGCAGNSGSAGDSFWCAAAAASSPKTKRMAPSFVSATTACKSEQDGHDGPDASLLAHASAYSV